MCGITGIWSSSLGAPEDAGAVAERMAQALAHRGPDEQGIWVSPDGALALGHRRLSVLDLSAAGHQPMRSEGGRFTLVFNGEIYNHLELRRALEHAGRAPAWRGHSDTETLLAAVEHWGVEDALRRAEGMFALALWDGRERSLYLARDRFGEKPLYFGWAAGAFLFASELKAFRAHPAFRAEICPDALADYLRLAYVPAPRSIYRGIYKVQAGCFLAIRGQPPAGAPSAPLDPGEGHGPCTVRRWWSLASVVEAGRDARLQDDREGLALLEERLSRAVRGQMLADVPVGAFLSGGVDSSLIVALMQRQSARRVQTFTIGFGETAYDESREAEAVASHLGTEHHTLQLAPGAALDVVPRLSHMYDEPFADSSQIPTHLVCRAARSRVTVALSGDGGDELFGGYNRYLWAPRVWRQLAWLPHPARQILGAGLGSLASVSDRTGISRHVRRPSEKLRKLGAAIQGTRSLDDLYRNLVATWHHPEDILLAGTAAHCVKQWLPPAPARGVEDARERMMYWDAMTYLGDDILCKVDRAAMATSLETRAPFLDSQVAELAWRLPMHMKVRNGETKWALRQILYQYVPRELIERPKTGFSVPLGAWLRGPLRDWAENLLDERTLREQRLLRPGPIRSLWSRHLRGPGDFSQRLWCILMFQAWLAGE